MLDSSILVTPKELYTGTPNSDLRILCTVHCKRNVNNLVLPQKLKGKDCSSDVILQSNKKQLLERILWLFGQYEKYNSNIFFFHPWALFPQKLCVAPEFFVLISSHCSTQIWRIRYGGSWSIYFLVHFKTVLFTILTDRENDLDIHNVSLKVLCSKFWLLFR